MYILSFLNLKITSKPLMITKIMSCYNIKVSVVIFFCSVLNVKITSSLTKIRICYGVKIISKLLSCLFVYYFIILGFLPHIFYFFLTWSENANTRCDMLIYTNWTMVSIWYFVSWIYHSVKFFDYKSFSDLDINLIHIIWVKQNF
jgi:hypothetical protein